MARYELKSGTSSKFWEIVVKGDSHTVTYGRIGTHGQSKTKRFVSTAEAKKQSEALIRSKTNKGYRPVRTTKKTATKKTATKKSATKKSATKHGGPDPKTYVRRFKRMVETLRKRDDIQVVGFWVNEGASNVALSQAQEKLGVTLSDDVLTLYRQANGLQLHWRAKGTPEYSARTKERSRPWREVPMDPWQHGAVNLVPLEWMGDFDYGGDERVLTVDLYSEYTMTALDPDHDTVLVGDDHGASFSYFHPIPFWTYLEGVLAVFGSYRGREHHMFRNEWQPEATHEWKKTAPKLQAILDECRLDEDAWDALRERELGSDEDDEDDDDDFGSYDLGNGPRLSEKVVLVTSLREYETKKGLKVWLKTRKQPEHTADQAVIAGGPKALARALKDNPDSDFSESTGDWDQNLLVSFDRFLIAGTYRPNVRVSRGYETMLLQGRGIDEVTRYFQKRKVKVLRLEDVGVLHVPGSPIRFDKPPGFEITKLV